MLHTSPHILSLLYCYAEEDEQLCMSLDKHLSILKNLGWLETWSEKDIVAGQDRQHSYRTRLQSADIILLLISPDFLASEFCQQIVQIALQEREKGKVLVIPVLLRAVDWDGAPFGSLQSLPTDRRPVSLWERLDDAFEHVAQGIRRVVEALRSPIVIIASIHDHAFATCLTQNLEIHRKHVWYQPASLSQDTATQQEEIVFSAIRSATSILFIASPDAPYSQIVTKSLSFATTLLKRNIITIWTRGKEWNDSIPSSWRQESYIDAREYRYEQAISQILFQSLCAIEASSATRSQASKSTSLLEPRNPYKGLNAFQGKDAGDFFGREQLIDEFVTVTQQVIKPPSVGTPPSRLLAIIGPSGSGKSSVALAGLLPALQAGALPGSQKWIYLDPIFPGAYPLEALAITLSKKLLGQSAVSLQNDLRSDSTRAFQMLAAQIAPSSEDCVVLLIDQFEELFTLTEFEVERQQFIQQLVTAVTAPRTALLVIVTLRADFYDRPMQYPELHNLVQRHQQFVLPMNISNLRSIIEGPAALPDIQLLFEKDLVGSLLFETQGQVGALPLLQFTLTQLFERRDGRQMTLSAYEAIGGVKGALAQHAETIYESLPSEEHKRLARALFLRLINAGAIDQDATKRRIALSELILSDAQETATLETVWKLFTKERLLTTSTIANTSMIELSHEALITAWQRVTEWIQDSHEDIYFQEVLRNDVKEWIRLSKQSDLLYKGPRLTRTQAWRKRNLPNRDEDAFLQTSIQQQQQEQWKTTRRAVIASIGAASLIGGTFIAGSLLQQKPTVTPPTFTQQLPYTYPGHTDVVNSVAWSPDGKSIASASNDHTIQVWNASTGVPSLVYKRHNDVVTSIAWSPDNKSIASASYDSSVQVWNVSDGALLLSYKGHTGAVYSATWSPDGKYIASAGHDRTVQVWNVSDGALLLSYKGHTDDVRSAAWSPDGKLIASAGYDRTVQVWNASTSTSLLSYKGHTDVVSSVTWSPDSKLIASASNDHTVQIWNASTSALLLSYKGHADLVNSIAWSPDGKFIASASNDHTVQIWNTFTGFLFLSYKGHTNIVNSVAWSPDSKHIASAGYDHTVQEWTFDFINISTKLPFLSYRGHTDTVYSAAWSPDGRSIASASKDSTVQVWNVSTDTLLLSYKGHTGAVYNAAWSPDGKSIASAGYDRTAQIWNASTGALLLSYNNDAYSVAWSPDGKFIASAGNDYTVQVWDASTGARLLSYKGHAGDVYDASWSPDGKSIASAGNDRTVQVWNAFTGALLLSYTGHTGSVHDASWSPDGKFIASASYDSVMQVWNASTGNILFSLTDDAVYHVAWSPDGKSIATPGYVQNASTGAFLLSYKGHTDSVYRIAWSPDSRSIASANGDKTVQIW